MICGQLIAAGIPATHEKTDAAAALTMYAGLKGGMARGRDVYVRRGDAPRAAELLAQAAPSDDELAELSLRSYEQITGHRPDS